MANNTNPWQWRSGDWKKRAASSPPYNGIQITGLPTYDTDNKLVSVEVTFLDFTQDDKGVESIIPNLSYLDGRVEIPVPVEKSSPPQADPDFTVLGWVALETNGASFSLRIRFGYGAEYSRRDELGYIMSFSAIKVS